jgi:pimeloyl-ACP methyl ester carboxylesterase
MPLLADAGFRAVAPWIRGYPPTEAPADGPYDVATLGADVNALHVALGGDQRAVIVGHDWGALSAYRAVVAEPSLWSRVVGLAVPPEPAIANILWDPWQLVRSWYLAVLQTPGIGRVLARGDLDLVGRLWRRWSPSHEPDREHLVRIEEMLRDPDALGAVLGYYRALRSRVLTRGWPVRGSVGAPPRPTLYLHGDEDGCVGVEFAAFARNVLAAHSRVEVLRGAGHFLHLERPDVVNEHIRRFLLEAAPGQ